MIYDPQQIQAALARYQQQPGMPAPQVTPPQVTPVAPPAPQVDPQAIAAAAKQHYGVEIAPPVTAPPVPDAAPQEMGMDAGPPPVAVPQTQADAIRMYAQDASQAADAIKARGEQTANALKMEAAQADAHAGQLDQQEREYTTAKQLVDTHTQELLSRAQELQKQADNTRIVQRSNPLRSSVALALAAIGDGFKAMGGDPNGGGLEAVNRILDTEIERDLQLQREALSNKQRAAGAAITEYGIARQMGLDAQSTAQFARGLMLQKQAAQADALAKSAKADDVRAAAHQLSAERAMASDKELGEMIDREARTRAYTDMARKQTGQARRGGGAPAATDYNPEAIAAKAKAKIPLNKDEARILQAYENSQRADENSAANAAADPVRAATQQGSKLSDDIVVADPKVAPLYAKEASKTQTQIDSSRRMIDAIDKLLEIRQANPVAFRTPFTDANSEAKSYGTTAQLEAKNVFELGALSGPDMALIENIAGDPTDWSPATDAKLRALRESTIKGVNDKLTKRGYAPVRLEAPKPAPARGSSQAVSDRVGKATTAPAGGMVRFEVNGKVGSIPADKADAFAAKYPNAKRL